MGWEGADLGGFKRAGGTGTKFFERRIKRSNDYDKFICVHGKS